MRNFYNDISWSFLISSPSHTGDFFEEAVILLLEDNEDGAFGIAINTPRGKKLGDISEEFESTPLEDVEVMDGGPVESGTITLAVCSCEGKCECGGTFAFGTSPKNAIEEISNNPDAKVAAFAGYSGWGPNQLKAEISEGEWIVSNADIGLIFDIPPEDIWRELLIRERPAFACLQKPKSDASLN